MPSPANLPAALLRHAALARQQPWLFEAEGWDWRWRSFGELADRMLLWAERLAPIPAGSRAAFPYVPRPAEVVLDLAIQAAGLVSMPLAEQPQGREAEVWIGVDGDELRISGSPSAGHRGEKRGEAGGAVVIQDGEIIEWTAAEVVDAAVRLQGRLPLREGGREIVVLGGPLQAPSERTMLAWATFTGAAVLLEPNPALRVATAAWVRPTLFHGTREEIAGLRQWVEKERQPFWRRRPRPPFRRLRSLLVTAGEALAPEDEAFWRERGAAVFAFPAAGT